MQYEHKEGLAGRCSQRAGETKMLVVQTKLCTLTWYVQQSITALPSAIFWSQPFGLQPGRGRDLGCVVNKEGGQERAHKLIYCRKLECNTCVFCGQAVYVWNEAAAVKKRLSCQGHWPVPMGECMGESMGECPLASPRTTPSQLPVPVTNSTICHKRAPPQLKTVQH